jgi:hypothetical protein
MPRPKLPTDPRLAREKLLEKLQAMAERHGYHPGTKQHYSYVFGTLAREMKRIQAKSSGSGGPVR